MKYLLIAILFITTANFDINIAQIGDFILFVVGGLFGIYGLFKVFKL